jgi:5-methyltetrahydrofolate--homocysteine methyltransferase
MLESSGFTVTNLGVDVSAEAFAQAVRDHKPQVLGLSGLLTTTMLGMEDVIEELRARACATR